jgi:hypothetical protein
MTQELPRAKKTRYRASSPALWKIGFARQLFAPRPVRRAHFFKNTKQTQFLPNSFKMNKPITRNRPRAPDATPCNQMQHVPQIFRHAQNKTTSHGGRRPPPRQYCR